MASYKLYILDEGGHICEREDFDADNDLDAKQVAAARPAVHGSELWCEGRKVACIGPAHVPIKG